ncbi:MAG: hypothetical protein IIX85_05485 [Clostridia bacterium]|jgi:hypothetical protein|nr:hypothetical protein [Clostridia bacterium]MBQ2273554.1 hypothetical protein [Clostridia bacterium]MBQ5820938.1 hypothetical protein [Clostridia bacterium]
MAEETSFLTYKGRPLVRSGNVVFYGNLNDKYVVMMQILDSVKDGDLDKSTRVSVELQSNDPEAKPNERVIQKTERKSMADAMEIATIWLDRADEEDE